MTGSTRYGTAKRESTANAVDKAKVSQSGAFSYATMAETVRTRDAANVALTGLAEYTGGNARDQRHWGHLHGHDGLGGEFSTPTPLAVW